MYYVYILQSEKDRGLYIGYTQDLRRRFEEHSKGYSQSTKPKRPWVLVYYEAYRQAKDALDREFHLKHFGRAYYELKKRISKCLLLEAK